MSADLALAADPSVVERAADPGAYIIQACERAKSWLREALDHGDIDSIVECKSQAEAIRVYTMSKQLGKDAQLSATEIVRRAERGIGVAIRKGQAAGEIRKKGMGNGPGGDYMRNGKLIRVEPRSDDTKLSPEDFAGSGQTRVDIYTMADGISEQDFEAALAQAKSEGNLSRANVTRKVRDRKVPAAEWIPEPRINHGEAPAQRRKLIRRWAGEGYSSRQMAERLGMRDDAIRQIARDCGTEIPADAVIGGTRHHDSNRIVRETVNALEGLAMGVDLVDPGGLDEAEIANWTASLTTSIRALNRLIKTMKEIAQ